MRILFILVIAVIGLGCQSQEMDFDEDVLKNANKYYWSFSRKYSDKKLFIEAFKEYNKEIGGLENIQDFIVFKGKMIEILYQGAVPNEEDYRDMEYIVKANEESGISFFELMYQFNNGTLDYMVESDRIFYEGLKFSEINNGKLVLWMRQGS